jgi:ABC-type multidrug transport system ATPase subunit
MIRAVPGPPPRPTPALRFTEVSRRYGRLSVLRDVSGAVGAGEVLLVTGPNGSGKSTLLRCLAGLLAPDAGTIELRDGYGASPAGAEPPPLDAAARRRAVGYVAPDLAFYEELTTAENLAFFARLRDVPAERGTALLDRLGLPRDRAAGALSSGMRQKLRWCWALLHRPALLLLDEPFQNLDAQAEALVRGLLADHLDGGGLAVLAQPVDPAIDSAWRVAALVALAG